jgi:hypothetical protein
MRRLKLVTIVAAVGLVGGMLGLVPAQAGHDDDIHSDNIKLLTRKAIKAGDVSAQGSDLAFDGKRVYAGSYQGTALYKAVSKKKGYLKQIGFHNCPSSQGDISFVGKFVFVSVDTPGSNGSEDPRCNNTKATGFIEADKSTGLEGVRVVDFSDPKKPKQVAFVSTRCGSHTHTLVPDGATTYMYVESYPVSQTADCNAPTGHGAVDILSFPTNNPAKLKVEGQLDVTQTPLPNDPPIGCHDLQAWPEKNIVIAACITEAQVWNIEDPAKPVILSRITNPDVQIWHSAAFTWDGKYAIISDEYGGAAGGGGCAGDANSTVGAMWFYNIEDPAAPVESGHYSLPRIPPTTEDEAERSFRCTTHLYNILPTKNGKYIAVASYYMGGISVVDFTDPAAPVELGHYLQQPGGINPDSWAGYWYNGRIYTNDHESQLGVTVFKMKGLGPKQIKFFRKGGLNPQTQISNFS